MAASNCCRNALDARSATSAGYAGAGGSAAPASGAAAEALTLVFFADDGKAATVAVAAAAFFGIAASSPLPALPVDQRPRLAGLAASAAAVAEDVADAAVAAAVSESDDLRFLATAATAAAGAEATPRAGADGVGESKNELCGTRLMARDKRQREDVMLRGVRDAMNQSSKRLCAPAARVCLGRLARRLVDLVGLGRPARHVALCRCACDDVDFRFSSRCKKSKFARDQESLKFLRHRLKSKFLVTTA